MPYLLEVLDDGETSVVSDVMNNMGLEESEDEDHNKFVEFLKTASDFDILDKYLTWNGIIGFTNDILDVINKIREAEIKPTIDVED